MEAPPLGMDREPGQVAESLPLVVVELPQGEVGKVS